MNYHLVDALILSFLSLKCLILTSYLQKVDPLDLAVAKDVCCEIPQDASFEMFSELAQMMSENNIESPGIDIDKIECLYIDLLEHIQAIV